MNSLAEILFWCLLFAVGPGAGGFVEVVGKPGTSCPHVDCSQARSHRSLLRTVKLSPREADNAPSDSDVGEDGEDLFGPIFAASGAILCALLCVACAIAVLEKHKRAKAQVARARELGRLSAFRAEVVPRAAAALPGQMVGAVECGVPLPMHVVWTPSLPQVWTHELLLLKQMT